MRSLLPLTHILGHFHNMSASNQVLSSCLLMGHSIRLPQGTQKSLCFMWLQALKLLQHALIEQGQGLGEKVSKQSAQQPGRGPHPCNLSHHQTLSGYCFFSVNRGNECPESCLAQVCQNENVLALS